MGEHKIVNALMNKTFENARETLTEKMAADSQLVIKKRTLAWIGAGVLAIFVGKALHKHYVGSRARLAHQANHLRQDWKLDAALEDSMDASDAVAKY